MLNVMMAGVCFLVPALLFNWSGRRKSRSAAEALSASAGWLAIALRLHLDDSTVDNGPLRVIADSHRKGVLKAADIASLVAIEYASSLHLAGGLELAIA